MSPAISAVVNTLDAERFLAYALRSVASWVNEIVVVDMGSTDGTVAIARHFGATVVDHPRTGLVEAARDFACEAARGPWLLVLDADEIVPPQLARRLRAVADTDEADAVRVARCNYLLGAPLRHSGWNPSRDVHLRFFRRGAVEFLPVLHTDPRPRPEARVTTLGADDGLALVHLNYLDLDDVLARISRYSGIEAAQAFAAGTRASRTAALRGAAREWLTRFVRHGGYRDGWRGFYLALVMACARVVTQAKLAELEAVGPREAVEQRYREVAEGVLAGYREGAAS
ncbi:MAG TPA: glycosyltransferase family 2 protein [Candidatus Binatia bacterium]|jgi:glycosyltransferase involved in cell wall biosynthesis